MTYVPDNARGFPRRAETLEEYAHKHGLPFARDWQPCWKLTEADHTSHGRTEWGPGIENPTGVRSGTGGLCAPGFYHAYATPYLPVFLNVLHANFYAPVLWRAEYRGLWRDDDGLKLGATEMRTIEAVPLPLVTYTQRVATGIVAAGTLAEAVLADYAALSPVDVESDPATWTLDLTRWLDHATDWLTGGPKPRRAGSAVAMRAALDDLTETFRREGWPNAHPTLAPALTICRHVTTAAASTTDYPEAPIAEALSGATRWAESVGLDPHAVLDAAVAWGLAID